MKRVKIIESEWGPNSLLSQRTGKKCCLGFLCLAEGLKEEEIKGYQMPGRLREKSRNKLPFSGGEGWVCRAANANDCYHKSKTQANKDRKLELMREAFREGGYQFVLVRDRSGGR